MISLANRHILHVRLGEDNWKGYKVTCPHAADDSERWCRMFVECMCGLEAYERVSESGEPEPCPGVTGCEHQIVGGYLCVPTKMCFVADNDWLADSADDLDLEPGDYYVAWSADDFQFVNLEVLGHA